MASLTDTFTQHGRPDGVTICRVAANRRHEALSLLLTGGLRGPRAAVDQFLGFASTQALNLDELWAAYRGGPAGQPVASALIVPSPGKTAMLFVSPVTKSASLELVGDLLRAACAAQEPAQLRLAQALLDPYQDLEAEALKLAGFRKLAHLVYMQRPAGDRVATLKLDDAIEVLPWGEAERSFFARAILASYEKTSDCPGLLGLREVDDIIDGHRATGEFVPSLWCALRHGAEPVGVLLLNPVLQRQALEVVYLGLARAWRGKGLGRKLMQHALGQAREHRLKHVILAVDEMNLPAMRLYQSMQFAPSARKLAMIFSLP